MNAKKITLIILSVILIVCITCGIVFAVKAKKQNTTNTDNAKTIENTNENDKEKIAEDKTKNNDSTNIEQPKTTTNDILIKSLTNNLQIHSGAGTNYAVVGAINQNDMVTYVEKVNGWYKTFYKGKTAYISANPKYTELAYFEKGSSNVEKVIELGKKYLGTPYVFGAERYHWGNGTLNSNFNINEFDCSSFTQYLYFVTNNVILGTTTRAQYYNGTEVTRQNLRRGDLMLFTNSSRQFNTGIERIGHVGIYLGNNYVLHTASDYAVIEPLSSTRWNNFIIGRRVLN